ncbi:HD domain-containing protein [Roseibium album]|uniref:HD domain-containing protein n=1 Tax=Roseibium album TaxID=311410 RepID=UPI002490337D|nr:HD domain-containing protein [Roseibium album]
MEAFCERPEKNAYMGTVQWGKRTGRFSRGRLTRPEKVKVLVNLARMAAFEIKDVTMAQLGLINAYGTDLEGLQPPDTALVRDAFDFADDVQNVELMRHSWRTYYWAMLIGGHRNLAVDREVLFAAAILHDVGLAKGRSSEPRECCFVVYGAERCKHHLVSKGHDRAKIGRVSDAIGLHLNGYVSSRVHGAEAHLLSRGAMCDVFGMGRRRIEKSIRRQILREHPVGDLRSELEIWPGHHLEGTRGDFLIRLGNRSKQASNNASVPQAGE